MSVKLQTEHHSEFLSLRGGCTGSFESTLIKMPHCWKSYVTAQSCFTVITLCLLFLLYISGAIRPDLYPRKDAVLQQSSLDRSFGRLHVRLKYDFRTSDLIVHLIEGKSHLIYRKPRLHEVFVYLCRCL